MKKKEKFIKKLIVFFMIVLILLCFIVGVVSFLSNREYKKSLKRLEYINSSEWNDELYPYTAYMLFIEYEGNMTAENIVKSMSYVSNQVFPKYYNELKDVSEDEVIKYYEKNKDVIRVDIGISSQKDFIKIIQSLKTLKTEEIVFKSYRIDKEKIKVTDTYIESNFYITYENNTEIGFNVKIYNSIKKDSSTVVYTSM